MSVDSIPNPEPDADVKILTDTELKRFDRFLRRLTPGDLELLAKMLWNVRKQQYKEWDGNVDGRPKEPKRYV